MAWGKGGFTDQKANTATKMTLTISRYSTGHPWGRSAWRKCVRKLAQGTRAFPQSVPLANSLFLAVHYTQPEQEHTESHTTWGLTLVELVFLVP